MLSVRNSADSEPVYRPCRAELGDIPATHVRRRSESRLPVATSPVPAGIDERRFLFEQLCDAIEVAVGVIHELVDQFRELRWTVL